VQAGEHHEVLASVEDLVERGRLPHQADHRADLSVLRADVEAGDVGLALIDAGQRGEGVDGRALAGAVRPQESMHRAGRDVEVEAVEGERVAVPLAQSARFEWWGEWHLASKFVRCTEFNGSTLAFVPYGVRRS
jgi:hypothetical protein